MKISYAEVSFEGDREINEDAITTKRIDNKLVMVVADGLGGHDMGEVASALVTSELVNMVDSGEEPEICISTAMRNAQNKLLEKQKEANAGNAMKTTAVMLLMEEGKAYFAHVGDSRGYAFFRNGKYVRTIDHSVPQMLALAGDIKESEIRYHQDRSSLLRVFGSEWEKDMFEISEEIGLKTVKAFLLCSDGFWELITEEQMKKTLKKSKTAADWLEKMLMIVRENGKNTSMDNYTAGAVFVEEDVKWRIPFIR